MLRTSLDDNEHEPPAERSRVVVRLRSDEAVALGTAAANQGRSREAIVREALRRHFGIDDEP